MQYSKRSVNSRLANISDNFESSLHAIFIDLTGLDGFDIVFPGESQNVECILAGNGNKLAVLGPVDVLRLNLDSANEAASGPVKKRDATLSCHTEKNATGQAISLKSNVKTTRLFSKVLVDLDSRRRLANGKVVAIFLRGPDEVKRGTKRFVTPRQSGVDNVLAVTADGNETSIGRVDQSLRVDFAGSEILGRQRNGITVLDFGI